MNKEKYVIVFIMLIAFITGCSFENNEKHDNKNTKKESNITKTVSELKKENEDIGKIVFINGKKINLDNIFKYEDIVSLNEDEISILRNSIYAKYGYKFKTSKYKNYFSKYDWYEPKYDDVNTYLTLSDLKNIDLILKLEKNFNNLSDKLTDVEKEFIGFWNLGAGVGAGYSDRYRFYNDRSFKFSISTMVFDERTNNVEGKWFILKDRLFLQIKRKGIITEGQLVDATHPGSASEKEIVGGKYKIQEVNPPEIKILTLDFESEKIEKEYAFGVLINDMDFYRLSQDPYFDTD
ncbi:YARHG domain-containing protein [Brassicibacter mesophilus]|uniref:YARHG domain-containing protein n=1 Tax=Brassicibacter mesophilus TaxID=745119 RepID=UPI003D20A84F